VKTRTKMLLEQWLKQGEKHGNAIAGPPQIDCKRSWAHKAVTGYSRFPDSNFPGWLFSRKDDSRIVTFPERWLPNG